MATNNQEKGKFIVFEGIDGSGKSTQIKKLAERLKEKQIACYETFEPTDSPIGSLIHQIMMGRIKTDNKVIAALFAADRLDHLLNETNGLCAKIDQGLTVLSDRYYFSSYAYHSVDMDMDWIINANSISADTLRPTCTIFIDVDPEVSLARIAANRYHSELFEKKERLIQTREQYLKAFERLKEEETVIMIDGNNTPDAIADQIWEEVSKLF